jgi:hypothetical protein
MFGYDDPYPEFSINPAGRWISFIDDLEFRIK